MVTQLFAALPYPHALHSKERQATTHCCRGFENLINSAGERGTSVFVRESRGGFVFDLHARALTKEDEILFAENRQPLGIKGNMTLSANIRLSYCPFCGEKLRSLIKPSTFRFFADLAKKHELIEPPWR